MFGFDSNDMARHLMPKDGSATRDSLLDATQALILDRGFAGMTLDDVVRQVGITKGAFFYHFKSKNDLGKALMKRYSELDARSYEESCARAEKLSRDPLQQLLIFIGLFEEMFENLTEPYPGCLLASYVYELQQFDSATKKMVAEAFTRWRTLLKEKLDAAVKQHPPKIRVDTASLADSFTVVLEGAFIIAKAVNEPRVVADQLHHFKNYIELLFNDRAVTARKARA
jgi:TetR/AcrR family transcriptional repressor of nem operon